jgi:hypothetical protein
MSFPQFKESGDNLWRNGIPSPNYIKKLEIAKIILLNP